MFQGTYRVRPLSGHLENAVEKRYNDPYLVFRTISA